MKAGFQRLSDAAEGIASREAAVWGRGDWQVGWRVTSFAAVTLGTRQCRSKPKKPNQLSLPPCRPPFVVPPLSSPFVVSHTTFSTFPDRLPPYPANIFPFMSGDRSIRCPVSAQIGQTVPIAG